jgi:phosphatidylinositol-3-phosphatase
MKKYFFLLAGLLLVLQSQAQPPIPRPDHVVVVIYENHGYSQIIGAAGAPHINAFVQDDHSALLTQSYAITHPSQPNYIDLYSGCNQGVLLDFLPTGTPWTTDNLGRQLIDSGFTWATYSEDLPSVGSDIETNLAYARKHNPAANWMGTGQNQIPPSTNQPFTAFPSNYDSLPTVCFVIPNLDHDMHDGSITAGDDWFFAHVNNYAQWAKTHNSLLIFTYDEDDGIIISSNHIVTVFAGERILQGHYGDPITHYSVLRAIEDMYGLPYACNANTAPPVPNSIWGPPMAAPSPLGSSETAVSIFPNPSNGDLKITWENGRPSDLEIMTMQGHKVYATSLTSYPAKVDATSLPSGIYLVKVHQKQGTAVLKWVKE